MNDELKYKLGKAHCIAMGLMIFAKHGDQDVSAEHDQLWAGAQIDSDEEIELLENLGWHWNPDYDSWSIFT